MSKLLVIPFRDKYHAFEVLNDLQRRARRPREGSRSGVRPRIDAWRLSSSAAAMGRQGYFRIRGKDVLVSYVTAGNGAMNIIRSGS